MVSFARTTGRFVFGRILPRRPYRVVSGPLKGARFVLGALSGEGGGATVYFNQMESEQTSAMIDELHPGATFFDVGANVGYYSILASRLVGGTGRVIAFEPVVRNLSFLQRHVTLNNAENVQILPFAVSNEVGVLSFSAGADNAMGHLDADGTGEMIVPATTLDDMTERLRLTPDVIKIDTEGAEMDVLQGAEHILHTAHPTIFLSTHSTDLRKRCLDYLGDAGYSVEQLVRGDDPHEFLARHKD